MKEIGIDKSMLEKAAELPEDQLKELIYAVVSAAGGSKMQARAAANNADKLKKKLKTLTEEEIAQAAAGVDSEKLKAIAALVKEKGAQGHG